MKAKNHPKPQKIDFGSIIRIHREQKRITQKQLAEMIGISYQLLQKYEYNKCRPPLERMFVITGILGININEINNEKYS